MSDILKYTFHIRLVTTGFILFCTPKEKNKLVERSEGTWV